MFWSLILKLGVEDANAELFWLVFGGLVVLAMTLEMIRENRPY